MHLTDLQSEMKSPLLRNYLKDGFTQQDLARQNDIDRAIVDEIPRLRALEQSRRERREANKTGGRLTDFMRLSMLRARLGMVGGIDVGEVAASQSPNMEVFRSLLVQAKMRLRRGVAS